MTDQLLARPPVKAWLGVLRGYRALYREFSARLQADHGLTQSDYEVLAQLSRAPERRLRRVDLVEGLQLTPSGITRLLDGLESAGLVAKGTCETDARVTYAVLTEAGYQKLCDATASHVADIERWLADFDPDELELLGSLPARISS